jgi:transposase
MRWIPLPSICAWRCFRGRRFRKKKGAVKLHTLLDLRGNIPAFIYISDGKLHDVNVLDLMIFEAGSFYVMDRGYIDFARLYMLHQSQAFIVTRAKSNLQYRRLYSRAVDKSTGLRCDQTILLTGLNTRHDYPIRLRRVKFYDVEHDKLLVFLTNNLDLPALCIAQLYRCRWQVELFFKWIKQHLRIKAFFGTSENAVKTQVWIAISAYVLVAIVKKRLQSDASLYTILQILSLTLFEKTPLIQLLTEDPLASEQIAMANQLNLFEF